MLKNRKLLFVNVTFLLILSLFSQTAFAVHIDIAPTKKGEEYYSMKLGQTQTFEACGFDWDKSTKQSIPHATLAKIQWKFDSRFLELIEKKENTITLRAIKARTSRLTVTGSINSRPVTKTIFVVIKPSSGTKDE